MDRSFRGPYVEQFEFRSAREFVHALAPSSPLWSETGAPADWIFRGHRLESHLLLPSRHRPRSGCSVDDVDVAVDQERREILEFIRLAKRRGLWVPPTALDIVLELNGTDALRRRAAEQRRLDREHQRIVQSFHNRTFPTLEIEEQTEGARVLDDAQFPPDSLWETMALAQHYGLPTRLLDWTRSSYVAAFFAAERATTSDARLAVWAFDPTPSQMAHANYLSVYEPPTYENRNASAQSGMFTIVRQPPDAVHSQFWELEHLIRGLGFRDAQQSERSVLRAMFLPHTEASHLLRLLRELGVDASTVYPGYRGVAKEAARVPSAPSREAEPELVKVVLQSLISRDYLSLPTDRRLAGRVGQLATIGLSVLSDGTDAGPDLPADHEPGRQVMISDWTHAYVRVTRAIQNIDVIIELRKQDSYHRCLANGPLSLRGCFEVMDVVHDNVEVRWRRLHTDATRSTTPQE